MKHHQSLSSTAAVCIFSMPLCLILGDLPTRIVAMVSAQACMSVELRCMSAEEHDLYVSRCSLGWIVLSQHRLYIYIYMFYIYCTTRRLVLTT